MITLIFSAQANALIRQSRDFNRKDFEEYLKERGVPIGSSMVMDYLMERDMKEGNIPNETEVVIDGSIKL